MSPLQILPQPTVQQLDAAHIALILTGTFGLCLLIAWVYKGTHRGLSYSQSFQFSLVVIGMLSAAVMMVARVGILNALGILGVFALVRFRTIVKDTKDMAYILFVLVVGLSMGTEEYALAVMTTAAVILVVLVLTRLNFGMSKRHESVVRVVLSRPDDGTGVETTALDAAIGEVSESVTVLSAHSRSGHVEVTYGIRPKRKVTPVALLTAVTAAPGVEDAELFDTKHQVEF
jgi:hypothetical protein